MNKYRQQAIITALSIGVLMVCPFLAQAQVPVALSPVDRQQFFSQAGAPLASGCIFTYITGTSTPLATYTDGTGTAQNTNPIILDAGGFANIWLSNSSYRFSIYSAGGVNCASGIFQRTVDNVSAYAAINTPQNLFLLGASSDPGGSAGELAYRTDIPCFRGFTTLWDCFVTLTGVQTLTNKTFANPAFTGTETGIVAASPTLNNPNINGTVITGPPATYLVMANNTTTGTTLNKLAKIDPSGLAGFALIAAITDTGGITGIVVAGAGITGNATIQQNGSVSCAFDNATTPGNYVQISSSIAGDCHDSGLSYPATGQVIGRSLGTGTGTQIIDLFGPEIKAVGINTVYSTTSATSAANIGATTMATAGGSGNIYQIQFYPTQIGVGAGCVSATTIQANLTWTDPNAAGPTTIAISILYSIVNNGTANSPIVTGTGVLANLPYTIRAKAATVVQYSTTYSLGGSCAPGPTYQITPVMVQLQ